MRALRVPVLTYHSYRISGDTYESNDHEALRADLRASSVRRRLLDHAAARRAEQLRVGPRGRSGSAGSSAPGVLLAVPVAAVACALVAFAAWFVLHERWIYFWDWSGYWRSTIDLAHHLRDDWSGALGKVVHSLRTDDYDLLPVLPLAPTTLLFGESRLAYVLAIVVLYGLPAAASIALFARRAFLRPLGAAPAATAVAAATVLVMPRLWLPTLVGLPDVVGCILVPFVWWALRGPVAQLSRRQVAGIGGALALLVILRRWYAYWAAAFVIALALEAAWTARGRPALRAAALRIAAIGAVALLVLLLATGSHGLAMLRTDYRSLYAAYRSTDPLRTAASRLLRDFGPTWLALAAAGLCLTLRSPRTRAMARLLLVQSVVIVVLFTRTQNFNAQHYYLLIPQIAALAGVAAGALAGLRAPLLRRTACALLALVLVGDFAAVFVPGVRERLGPVALAFSAVTYPPQVREDLAELARLLRALDERSRANDDKIYVLSSSVVLNEGIVGDAHLADPSLPEFGDRILPTSHVDQRDGFPWALAQARYVVLAEPVGYHLDPADQRVIGVPAHAMLTGSTIGRAFARLPGEFLLDAGTHVSIYERTRDVERQDLDALGEEIRRPLAAAAPAAAP